MSSPAPAAPAAPAAPGTPMSPKMKAGIVAVVVIIILAIVLGVVFGTKKDEPSPPPPPPAPAPQAPVAGPPIAVVPPMNPNPVPSPQVPAPMPSSGPTGAPVEIPLRSAMDSILNAQGPQFASCWTPSLRDQFAQLAADKIHVYSPGSTQCTSVGMVDSGDPPAANMKICATPGFDYSSTQFRNQTQPIYSSIDACVRAATPPPSVNVGVGTTALSEIPSEQFLRTALNAPQNGLTPQLKQCITNDVINQEAAVIRNAGYKFISGNGQCPSGTDRVDYSQELNTTLCKPTGSVWPVREQDPVSQQSMAVYNSISPCLQANGLR